MSRTKHPQAGDIVVLNLNPTIGYEQGGSRPNIIVSVPTKDRAHSKKFEIIIAVPLTTTKRNWWTVVPIRNQSGLRQESYALCHNIRAVSTDRVSDTTGSIDSKLLTTIRLVLRDILEIQ
ncbi:MAG: type II toxin-antitoxin system PemK/MazF family toxin [Candidatus Thorarchaeota archaeon]